MQIVCPNCATSYWVEPASLGAAGRSVRCVRCRSVWFAHDPDAVRTVAQGFPAEPGPRASGPIADGAEASADAATPAPIGGWPPPGTDGSGPDFVAGEPSPAASEQQAADPEPVPAAAEPMQAAVPQRDAPIAVARTIDPAPVAAPFLADATVGEDIETVAARRAREAARRRLSWPLPGLPTTIMTLIALIAVLIGWRADVVKIAPQTASLYAAIRLPVNLRGLAFGSTTTKIETQDGVLVLVVEGTIASTVSRTVEVPRLRFSVRNQRGQEIYSWTALPSRSLLSPGETMEFRSRLASPPPDGRNVLVQFFNRRDLVAGLQ